MQLVITLNPNGQGVTVQGPLDQKAVCYGMLELARDVVKDFDPNKATPAIVQANGVIPPLKLVG